MKYLEVFKLVNKDYMEGKTNRSEVLSVFNKLASRVEEKERAKMIHELMESHYE